MILKIVTALVSLLSMGYGVYLLITALPGFLKAKPLLGDPKASPRRFAVLLPARNEEGVITESVKSLVEQNYPKNLFTVFVIPNNCTDDTAGAALRAGATIMHCSGPVKNKGDVLSDILEQLHRKGEYDAYVVFDADNRVDPDFLREMNKAFAAGYDVAQGYREAINANASMVSASYAVYYWMDHYFFTQGRWNLGGSALVNGTGFAFSDAVYSRLGGWPTQTLTEDIEFSGICAREETRIAWVPKAITYDVQPETLSVAWKQRMRWTVGMYQCIRTLVPTLLRGGFVDKTKRWPKLDMALFYCFPIFGLLSCVTVLLQAIVFGCGEGFIATLFFFISTVGGVLNATLFMSLVAVISILRAKGNFKKGALGIIGFPILMLSWIPIAVACMFKRDQKWESINHVSHKHDKITNR